MKPHFDNIIRWFSGFKIKLSSIDGANVWVQVYNNFLEGICKLLATKKNWAKLA